MAKTRQPPEVRAVMHKATEDLQAFVGGMKKATAEGMPLPDMKKKIAEDLAAKYEKSMSKYPLGRYRDRIDANVEQVYTKTAKKS